MLYAVANGTDNNDDDDDVFNDWSRFLCGLFETSQWLSLRHVRPQGLRLGLSLDDRLTSSTSLILTTIRVSHIFNVAFFYGRPIGQAIVLCSYGFFFLFSSPNLSGRRLDVCHTSTHGGP